jgi:23S rRNA pseudouridine1911/1915/1917 synthase
MPRHALHAKTLGFRHPETGKEMIFNTDLPDDINQVIQRWRNYLVSREI